MTMEVHSQLDLYFAFTEFINWVTLYNNEFPSNDWFGALS